MDAAKAVAAGAGYNAEIIDLLNGKAQTPNPAPVGTILTMAGTGSEMNMGGVITAGEDNKKLVIMHPELYPKFSILDPEYTFTVPVHHSMAGCADILSHLMEQYFTPDSRAEVQDRMNEGLMKAVLNNSVKIFTNPQDYEARANIMRATSMALAGFQFMMGKPMFAFPIHYIGHELSSLYDMTHGVTLALITPAWMKQTVRLSPESLEIFVRFARNVLDIREKDSMKAFEKSIQKLYEYYSSIGMPKSLRDAGEESDKLEYLAEKATERGELGILTTIGKAGALEILRESYC